MGLFSYVNEWINERGSANILRERIALLEQQHRAETQKLKTELDTVSEELRAAKGERDLARDELQHTKNELAQVRNRVSLLEPLAAKAREMAITVGFRKAFFGSGYVLVIQNKTTKPQALSITITDAIRQKTKSFRIVADGGTAQGASFHAGSAIEIGHTEGWAFASGDNIEIACPGFDIMRITVP